MTRAGPGGNRTAGGPLFAIRSSWKQLFIAWAIAVAAVWAGAVLIGALGGSGRGDVALPRSTVEVLSTWDGQHYGKIAQRGHSVVGVDQRELAFFPMLPLLARALGGTNGAVLAGILLNQLSLLASMILLSTYASGRGAARYEKAGPIWNQPGFWLLVSPVGFFFLAFYAESLFLLTILVAFLAYRRQGFLTATVSGLASGLIRPTAICVPALFVLDLFRKRKPWPGVLLTLCCVAAPLVGLLLYFSYVGYLLGDPLAYIRVQRLYFSHLGAAQISIPFAADWRELRAIAHYLERGAYPPLDLPASILSTAVIIALICIYWRKLDPRLLFYSVASLIFIHSATAGASSARYELMIFPAFVLAAKFMEVRPRIAILAAAASIALNMALFYKHVTWEFVA